MSNTTTNANGNSGASSDFIDFYQLLGADNEATTTALRRRINDLYTEAQSNRDHRNPTKRRRYEALCELLPYCRIVLLDPDKRVRYDRYREQFQAGTTVPAFENMMDEIAGRIDDLADGSNEKIGLLGVEGDDDLLPLTAQEAAGHGSRTSLSEPLPRETHSRDSSPRRSGLFDKPSPRAAANRAATPAADTPTHANLPPVTTVSGNAANVSASSSISPEMQSAPPMPSRSSSTFTPVAYGIVALVVGFLVSNFLMKASLDRSLLIGIVLGIIAYVLANSLSTPSNRRNRIS